MDTDIIDVFFILKIVHEAHILIFSNVMVNICNLYSLFKYNCSYFFLNPQDNHVSEQPKLSVSISYC